MGKNAFECANVIVRSVERIITSSFFYLLDEKCALTHTHTQIYGHWILFDMLHSLRSLISINFDFLDCVCVQVRVWNHQEMLRAAALDDDDDDEDSVLLLLLLPSLAVEHSHMRDVVCNSMRSYYRTTTSRPIQAKRAESIIYMY